MQQLILSFATALLTVLALASCSASEDVTFKYPYLSMLSNTECLNVIDAESAQSRAENGNGYFEMVLEGTTAKCKFISLDYPCDFEKVNVNVTYNKGTLSIVEYPSSDKADCRCETNAAFSIKNIPEEDFILKIYHGDTTGNFIEETPKYTGRFNIMNGSITIPYQI